MMKHYKLPSFLAMLLIVLSSASVWAQETIEIRGKITDSKDGVPLPGVTIIEKGTTRGTATDINGEYSMNVSPNAVLVVSFIGYLQEEIAVNNRSIIDYSLIEDITTLGEVVVVGYGTQRREDVTGSVATVSEKDFNLGQMTTPEQLLQGKVAGVQITSNGGAPGSGARIRIRGGSSLNANNDPLIVIDGVPLDNTQVSGAANPLSFINPNDIESFNILKDASATAIYGSRASNGVIIITTKKGKRGDALQVNYSTTLSIAQIASTVDILSGDEFRQVVQQQGDANQIALLGNENTDWFDVVFRDAFSQDHTVSLTGAYKILPYRLSVGYLNQDGILKTSNLERTSGTLNLNPTFFDSHLKVNLNLKGTINKSRFADEGAIGAAARFDPTKPVYDPENSFGGYYEWVDGNNPHSNATRNPLSLLEQRDNVGEVKRGIGNLQLDYTLPFFPDLRANLNLGYDVTEGEGYDRSPVTSAANYVTGGSVSKYSQTKTNKLLDFFLNYVTELPSIKSRVDVTGGYSYQSFLTEQPPYARLNVAGDTLSPPPNLIKNPLILTSFFGRMNYTFNDRYLLTVTLRRDGSSRFSEENRWGMFPALALAWRISEENFLKNSDFVSDLKLRAGYGVTGQQDIGTDAGAYFPYLPTFTYSDETAMYQFGNTFYRTLRPSGYDRNIKWEETETWNVGLDFGLVENRLSGSVDYYYRKTKDLLALVPVASGTNLTNELFSNVGNIEGSGIEAALNYTVINSTRLLWDISANITFNQIEITNLSKVEQRDAIGIPVGGIAGGTGNRIQVHSVGYAPNAFYVFEQVYNSDGKPIEGLYVDRNGDGVVDDLDKYRYKSPNADMFFGFNSQLQYDKWSLGFALRGSVGNYMYNNINSDIGAYRNISFSNYLTNVASDVLNTNFENNQYFSDYFVEDASFLRMENITLGYDFGSVFQEKANLSVALNVQNAFVITNYKGLDPETQFTGGNIGGGIDNNFYPRPRMYSFMLNLGF